MISSRTVLGAVHETIGTQFLPHHTSVRAESARSLSAGTWHATRQTNAAGMAAMLICPNHAAAEADS